jgi:hypothetical protein
MATTTAPPRTQAEYAPEIPARNLPPVPYRDLPDAPPLRKVLGPSVILVGVGIAAGEYILWPYISSQVGLVFLWAVPIGVLMQYYINMEVERYTLATGEDGRGRLHPNVEAARHRDVPVRDRPQHLARLGHGRRDREHVPVRRRRRDRHRHLRPARDRAHAHDLAGRLPDPREDPVREDRRCAGLPRGGRSRRHRALGLGRHERRRHPLRAVPGRA